MWFLVLKPYHYRNDPTTRYYDRVRECWTGHVRRASGFLSEREAIKYATDNQLYYEDCVFVCLPAETVNV